MASTSGGTESPDAPRPRVIGDRYEVIRILGEGASARTLMCSDRQGDRRIAVKELHFEHLTDWKYLELFEREARALARLDHRGIPKVFDFFRGEGTPTTLYIVQEFIEGVSLKQRMEAGPMLGQQEVFDVALSLLDVLEYLHGRAPPVLHRDVKPSNVLIRSDGSTVLVDFGGVSVGWRPPGHTGTTVVGTFGYMPPEQLLGQSGPTSDLYALGATLLHLVTGTPPGDFSFESGRIEVPADLPARDSMVWLIDALLRTAPRDRPQTAADARRILTDGVRSAPPATPTASSASALVRSADRRSVAIVSGDGPRFVDLGRPPRDPKGEFQDVYRNLVNPLFPAKMLWSSAIQAFALVLYGAVSVGTLGIAPYIYFSRVRRRKRQYTDVFQYGEFTRGFIRSAQKAEIYGTFKYEFEVAGSTYISYMEYAVEMARYWGEGDVVPVLYDPHDPQRSCFVYR